MLHLGLASDLVAARPYLNNRNSIERNDMLRSKLGLLSLCALALGLMAFAGSAQASEWLILTGKEGESHVLKTATELPAEVKLALENEMGTLLTHLSGLAVSVLCTGAGLENTQLEGGGKLTEGGKVTFTGCTVPVPAGEICTVKSKGGTVGTIKTLEGKGQLEKEGDTKISPKTGETFAELVFGGEKCTLPTEVSEPIHGVLWIKDCELNASKESKIKEHLIEHLIIEDTSKGHTLWIGSDTAEHLETSIDGSAWAKLAGGHVGLLWGGDPS
jgi:hypothetical protein